MMTEISNREIKCVNQLLIKVISVLFQLFFHSSAIVISVKFVTSKMFNLFPALKKLLDCQNLTSNKS
jgi:hypothetical protein